jgi:NAD-dependent SIR2 family protein deacetylase
MEKAFIYDQHQIHQDWLSRLQFYKEEIYILKERLQEITSKNSSKEALAKAEHFQNQFIVQRNNIDELVHSIKVHEDKIVQEIEKMPPALDRK